ncbi:carbohydrate binding domain-containing protein [Hymenobacter sp. BT523]|uniref:carbohydrate binding domain-containing protein n=1 Tax=Hymenobacter sp. BT523 TaxID=2795725 RepID=UPI0018EAEC9F|nr:carbohydrate binding domain-containing protein [Hymenobacter sp. BT523]MBJ6107447.1 carbohydrate binding domain-containing protein [Hymenobacter sp. BT523]
MRFSICLALGLLAAASGCASPSTPENQLLGNDFESLDGWGTESPSLTREKAHSGQYSIKIQKGIEYSLTYKNLLAKLSPEKITKIRVSGYVYITKPTDAKLAVQLMKTAADGTEFNEGINLGEAVKKVGEWTKVEKEFTLPADAAPSNQLRVYMWGAGNDDTVYLDDLQVTKA